MHGRIEVAHDPRIGRNHLQQPRRNAGAVEVHVADPRNRRLAHERLEQLGQRHAIATVTTVMGQVLRHEIHLARALHLQQLRFFHQVVERERPVLAAHERNGAERTPVVAPFGDLEVAHVRQVAAEQAHPRVLHQRPAQQATLHQFGDEPIGF